MGRRRPGAALSESSRTIPAQESCAMPMPDMSGRWKTQRGLMSSCRCSIDSPRLFVDRRQKVTTLRYFFFLAMTGWLYTLASLAQTNPRFNVNLEINYTAADQAILLLEGVPINTQALAELR